MRLQTSSILPWITAKTKGQLAARALAKVAATGQVVVNASANLGGKAIGT